MKYFVFFGFVLLTNHWTGCQTCFTLCQNQNHYLLDSQLSLTGSGTLCLVCSQVGSQVDNQSSITFTINQTNPLSLNDIRIRELVFNIRGTVVIRDHENDVSMVWNNQTLVTDQRFGFTTDLLTISVELNSNDTNAAIDWQTLSADSDSDRSSEDILFRLVVDFNEIAFNSIEHEIDVDVADGSLTVDYEANAVRTWRLYRSSNDSYGIVLNITHLDLDIDFGDYLLISSQRQPNDKLSSVSHMITTRKWRSIYSNCDRIYVQMVTHGSSRTGRVMQMVWSALNQTYDLDREDTDRVTDRVRQQSLHMCVIGHKCPERSLQWRTSLAQHLNDLIFDGSLLSEEFITKNSIMMFDRENRSATGVGSYCSAKLAITRRNDRKTVIFDGHTLGPIVFPNGNNFYVKVGNQTLEISDCDFFEMSDPEVYEIVIYLVIPLVSVCLFICLVRHNRNSLTNKSLDVFKKPLKRSSETRNASEYLNINSELNVHDFTQLESDNELTTADLRSVPEYLTCLQSASDQMPIIELKVNSKKRASILNRNFSEKCLQSKGSTAENINYSI